jgi:hypothetical protein
MSDQSFSSTNAIVLRQVLDRAEVATVSGLLGVAISRYLDAAERGPDDEAFAALTSAHRSALSANRNMTWCLERFGGGADLLALGSEVNACARWLDDAYQAIVEARRPRSAVRMVVRRLRRRPAGPGRSEAAREYGHAAMAFSERVGHVRALLHGDDAEIR